MKLTRDFTKELNELRQSLSADFAIISHIENDRYTVEQIGSDIPSISAGDEFKTEATYCKCVVDTNNTVMYAQVGNIETMVLHPIYTAMQLESYIGEPLRLNGNIIGTLNFSAFEPKDEYSDIEISSVKSLARTIEKAIA